MQTMKYMKASLRVVILLLISISSSITTYAQNFSIFNVDASKFPTMSARIVAVDAQGKEYTNFQANEFDLKENGVSMNSSVAIRCTTISVAPAADVILVVDRSGSMSDKIGNETRWDWVKQGVTEFVNQFPFNPPSQVALLSFGSTAQLDQDFVNNKTPIINAINTILPQGGTNYNYPCLDTNIGIIKLMKKRNAINPQIRKIVIFLTDGDPQVTPLTDSIIKGLNGQGVVFYSITVGLPMNPELRRISNSTGGKTFEVFTKDKLAEVYRLIALETTLQTLCSIEWTAPYGCDLTSLIRNVDCGFKRLSPPLTSSTQYIAPDSSIAKVGLSSSIVYFGDPDKDPPNNTQTNTITFTATNTPLRIDSLDIKPTTFFRITDMAGKSYPIYLKKGESWTPTITFTQQGSKAYRQAKLIMIGYPCPPTVTLVGGQTSVQVVYPNGNEIISACDSINIQWAGVGPQQEVAISYTTDGTVANPNWNLITGSAKGLSYRWKPPVQGLKYRLRITANPPKDYLWVSTVSSTEMDSCRSIALDAQQLFVHTAGYFNGSARLDAQTQLTSAGYADAFIARYDSDGNLIWAKSGGGNNDDRAIAITTDNNDGIWVTGNFTSKSVQFGAVQLNMPNNLDVSNFFLVKYDVNGNASIARQGGGTSTAACNAKVDSIAFFNNQIYVFGKFTGTMNISPSVNPPYYERWSAVGTNPNPFTAVFDLNGKCVTHYSNFVSAPYTKSTVTDKNGNLYETGGFSGQMRSGSITSNSAGSYDAYVRKYGGQSSSADISDTTFKVTSPILQSNYPTLDVGKIAQGQQGSKTFTVAVCNKGDLPLLIDSTSTIVGINGSEFKLISRIAKRNLFPGECLDLEILFSPTDIGPRSATLNVIPNCGQTLTIPIIGEGLKPCGFRNQTPTIGSSSVNIPKTVSRSTSPNSCILINDAIEAKAILVQLVGTNASEFDVTVTATGSNQSCKPNGTGCTITLQPGECLAFDAVFTPLSSGTRTAKLVFNIPSECGGNQEVSIAGEGIAPRLSIDTVDFGLQRVGVTQTKQITIKNVDIIPANITKIDWATMPELNFKFGTTKPPGTPYQLAAGSQVSFDIEYTPTDENKHLNYVSVESAGNSTPLTGKVSGEGFVPKIAAADIRFNIPLPKNQTSTMADQQYLVIHNTDSKSPLLIKSVRFTDLTGKFEFGTPAPGSNFSIPKLDSARFEIKFTPESAGIISRVISIMSDAAPGGNPDVETKVRVTGEGLDLGVTNFNPFGDVLVCDSTQTQTVTLSNPGSSAINVSYTLTTVTGSSTAFEVTQPTSTNFAIPAGGSTNVTVRFKPTIGAQEAKLDFTGTPVPLSYTLTGKGTGSTLKFTMNSPEVTVGNGSILNLKVTATDLKNVSVNKIEVDVLYDQSFVELDLPHFVSTVGTWTWVPTKQTGFTRFTGTNSAALTTGTSDLFNIPFYVYATKIKSFPITLRWNDSTNYSCLTPDYGNGQAINVVTPCFAEGLVFKLATTAYAIQVAPNPARENVKLTYGIGFNTPYKIELYNSMGELVSTIDQGHSTAGIFEKEIDVTNIPSGVYFIRLNGAEHVVTSPLTIAK